MNISELMNNTLKIGGLPLRNQEFVEYKNGVKFIIKKAYIKDGLLDTTKKYAIIIIPESNINVMDDGNRAKICRKTE